MTTTSWHTKCISAFEIEYIPHSKIKSTSILYKIQYVLKHILHLNFCVAGWYEKYFNCSLFAFTYWGWSFN